MPTKKLQSIAIHEAGHVVIALRSRLKVSSVSIIPDEVSNGRMRHSCPLKADDFDFDGSNAAKNRKVRALREQREREMQDKAMLKLADAHQLLIDLRNYSGNSPHVGRYCQASSNVVAAYEQIYASLTPPKPTRPTHLRLVE